VLDDLDVQRFTRIPVPAPPGFVRDWHDRYEQGRRDGTSEAFALVDEQGASSAQASPSTSTATAAPSSSATSSRPQRAAAVSRPRRCG
jgi:hypothetical protein